MGGKACGELAARAAWDTSQFFLQTEIQINSSLGYLVILCTYKAGKQLGHRNHLAAKVSNEKAALFYVVHVRMYVCVSVYV